MPQPTPHDVYDLDVVSISWHDHPRIIWDWGVHVGKLQHGQTYPAVLAFRDSRARDALLAFDSVSGIRSVQASVVSPLPRFGEDAAGSNLCLVVPPTADCWMLLVIEFGCQHQHAVSRPHPQVHRFTCACGHSYAIDHGD